MDDQPGAGPGFLHENLPATGVRLINRDVLAERHVEREAQEGVEEI
ncbi:MAG: hypothetical protein HY716_08780 [Planctomycetes bacterium]|nr:hypothetical protein [Planctomycetota bacterium]